MALTAYKVVVGQDLDQLAVRVVAQAAIDGKNVHGPVQYNVDERNYMQTMVGGAASIAVAGATTGYDVVSKNSIDELEVAVLALADTWLLVGPAIYNPDSRLFSQTVVQGGIAPGV